MNRAERRRRTINKYNSRVKLFYQIGWGKNIKVSEDEAYPNDKRYAGTQTIGDTHWHKAESWKEAKERSNWYIYIRIQVHCGIMDIGINMIDID